MQQKQVRGFMVQKTVVVPQLQFIVGRRHDFRAAETHPVQQIIDSHQLQFVARWSMSLLWTFVLKTSEIPQLQLFIKGFYIPVVAQWLSRMVQTVADHSDSPVARRQVGRCPCYAGRRLIIWACRSSTFLS